jgi:hypothetical protein
MSSTLFPLYYLPLHLALVNRTPRHPSKMLHLEHHVARPSPQRPELWTIRISSLETAPKTTFARRVVTAVTKLTKHVPTSLRNGQLQLKFWIRKPWNGHRISRAPYAVEWGAKWLTNWLCESTGPEGLSCLRRGAGVPGGRCAISEHELFVGPFVRLYGAFAKSLIGAIISIGFF